MDFTLRFMLGITLVLATCSVLEGASSWRHIRQAPPIEASPEAPILHDDLSTVNASAKKENISNNANRKIEIDGQLRSSDNDNQTVEKNEVEAEKKPKTENSTEKQTRDNKINVNKTSNEDNTKITKNTDNKNETSLEKPLLKDLDTVAADVKQNYLKKESQKISNAQQKETTENVPEIKQQTPTSRIENSRSLDMDISKYVSSEFHNKNNVYSLSVSPDTEKYTNLHNDLPKSTTSRLPTETPSQTIFGAKLTTPLDDDFDKKYQTIEDGVKQKLEYIDHEFAEAEHDFKKSSGEPLNVSQILDQIKNDSTVNLNYNKFTNIADNNSRDKNSIHKETDVETGQNIDFSSSYNKTQIFVEQPKDYKNKISSHEEDMLSEVLPEHTDTKSVHKPTAKSLDSKHLELEPSNEKIPEINFKESTSLTKPPSLNQTENQKSLISNKIETEVPNPVENNMKMKWDFPFISTETATERSTTRTSTTSSDSLLKSGQEEIAVDIPYGKGNVINVSKRGSTKFIDTIKATTTTETSINNKNINSSSTNKLTNKLALPNRKNKTIEQSVLENQVYPVQIPAPDKDQKDEKVINDTTEKSITTEDSTLSLKLYTMSHVPTSVAFTTLKSHYLSNQTNETVTENFTTTQVPEFTAYTINNTLESTTILNVTQFEKTITEDILGVMTTIKEELETTTTFENLIIVNTEATVTTTILPPTTSEVQTTATNYVIKNNDFTTTTYRIDFTTDLNEENSASSQEYASVETTSSEEVVSDVSYSTDSEYLEYSDANTTLSNYAGSVSTSNSTDYSEYDERSSSGRDLKGNSNDASFSSIDESLNNLDLSSASPTTEDIFNHITTEESISGKNKTEDVKTTTTRTGTTSDYRDNIIIKQSTERTTSTKRPEETSQDFDTKTNLTDNEGDDNGEYETGDDGDLDGNDHSTLASRNVKPHPDDVIPDTTPFIIPLNTSMMDTDGTDSTTIGDNLGLGTDDNGEGNGGQIAAIVISCIGAACLVLLAGLLFIMRKRHKRFNYGQRCTPVSLDAYSVDNVSVYNSMRRKGAMRASKRSYGNPAFEDPSSVTRSLNFPALAKFSSNLDAIAKEFEEIPQVTAQTNELPEGCETKNRYANVIPLPETRVFLNAIDGYPNSDYINANYVTGPKSTRGYYIACQAPMQSTVDDFWRMVWEQQTKVILMLTHLFENGTEKCVDYLPPSEVLDCHRLFGDFQVTLKKREVKEKYVISSLQLKNMVSNSWREVTHLWYLGWPEKGVPSEANSLIAFLIEARSYFKTTPPAENGKPKETTNDSASNGAANSEQSPVIVHCSPGTGRTGTVIACDIAIREFEQTRQVDIPKTVYRIRRDRASSVQTKEQYGFIYKVICLYATKLTGGVLDSL